MLRHNAAVHKLLPQDPSGRPFIQNNPSIPTGFNDLAFIDFSCKKFAHIAQVTTSPLTRRWASRFPCVNAPVPRRPPGVVRDQPPSLHQ